MLNLILNILARRLFTIFFIIFFYDHGFNYYIGYWYYFFRYLSVFLVSSVVLALNVNIYCWSDANIVIFNQVRVFEIIIVECILLSTCIDINSFRIALTYDSEMARNWLIPRMYWNLLFYWIFSLYLDL